MFKLADIILGCKHSNFYWVADISRPTDFNQVADCPLPIGRCRFLETYPLPALGHTILYHYYLSRQGSRNGEAYYTLFLLENLDLMCNFASEKSSYFEWTICWRIHLQLKWQFHRRPVFSFEGEIILFVRLSLCLGWNITEFSFTSNEAKFWT